MATIQDLADEMGVGAEAAHSHFRAVAAFNWRGKAIKPGTVFSKDAIARVAPHKVPSMIRAGLIEPAPAPRKKATKKKGTKNGIRKDQTADSGA